MFIGALARSNSIGPAVEKLPIALLLEGAADINNVN